MVSRSLEKMMLIAIGLSTAVIVGVPVLMYAIDTINTTTQLQEFDLMAEQIHNATSLVDSGANNSTTITIWVNPNVSVESFGNRLRVSYVHSPSLPQVWDELYDHDIVVDDQIMSHQARTLYTMEVNMVDNVIHISFFAVPV